MMPGVHVLATAPTPCPLAMVYVAAHVLECLLKAYLSRDGNDEAVKEKEIRHDLEALWNRAFEEGLPIDATAPQWVVRLAQLHRQPFHLRYSTGVHGVVLPPSEPMVSDLAALLPLVEANLR